MDDNRNLENPLGKRSSGKVGFNLWFISLAIGEFVFFLLEIFGHRMGLHDFAAGATVQYYVMNGIVTGGEIPLWAPGFAHGKTIAFWYVLAAHNGFLAKALPVIGLALKQIPFLVVFYAGHLLDRLVLLSGVWLLGTIYFRSNITRFFISVTIMGSTIIYCQPAFNFYILYCLPLVIYLLHIFLKTAHWRWFFWAGFISLLQSVGNMVYFIPVFTFTIFVYFIALMFFDSEVFTGFRQKIRWERGALLPLSLLFIMAFLIVVFLTMSRDIGNTVQVAAGRSDDGKVSLLTFLSYAGNTGLGKWNELIIGYSPNVDYTLYFGLLGFIFAVTGCFYGSGLGVKAVRTTATVLLLLSSGSLVSIGAYHLWPLMKYYRHLGLLAMLIKLWLCFLAGFAFDSLLRDDRRSGRPRVFIFILCVLGLCIVYLKALSVNPDFRQRLLFYMYTQPFPIWTGKFILQGQLGWDFSVFLILLVIFFCWRLQNIRPILLGVLILCHGFDCYTYRFEQMLQRTFVMSPKIANYFSYRPLDFVPSRDANPVSDEDKQLIQETPLVRGTWYYIFSLLTRTESAGTIWRDNYFPVSYWDYLNIYFPMFVKNKEREIDFNWTTSFFGLASVPKPVESISAITMPKLQFFDKAVLCADKQRIVALMTYPGYGGDQLLLWGKHVSIATVACTDDERLLFARSNRIDAPFKILSFGPNHIDLTIDNLHSGFVWLFYSDNWHPNWRAKVNGRPARVYRANWTYKAVLVPPGQVKVSLRFVQPLQLFFYYFFAIASIGGLLFCIRIFSKIIVCKIQDNPAGIDENQAG